MAPILLEWKLTKPPGCLARSITHDGAVRLE